MRGCGFIMVLLLVGCQHGPDKVKKEPGAPPSEDPFLGVAPPPPLPTVTPLRLTLDAPPMVAPGRDFETRIAVSNPGERPLDGIVVRQLLPPGVQVARTDPPAQVAGNELIWSLPLLVPGGTAEAVATLRAQRDGALPFSAQAGSADLAPVGAQAVMQVGVAQLSLRVDGPTTASRGERIPCEIRIGNAGSSTVTKVKVSADFDAGLEHESGVRPLEWMVEALPPGEVKIIAAPLKVQRDGRLRLTVAARAHSGVAVTEEHAIDVREMRLAATARGPERVMMNQVGTWTVSVRNAGDAPIAHATLRVQLPPELRFESATAGGKASGGLVTWSLGSLAPGAEQRVEVSATAKQIVKRTTLMAIAAGDRAPEARADQPVTVVGVPLLRLSIRDTEDPIEVGSRVVYTMDVQNAGSMSLKDIDVAATLPPNLTPLFGFGPTLTTIDGRRVSFARIPAIEPGQSLRFQMEAEAGAPGDARVTLEARSSTLREPVTLTEATRILPKN